MGLLHHMTYNFSKKKLLIEATGVEALELLEEWFIETPERRVRGFKTVL